MLSLHKDDTKSRGEIEDLRYVSGVQTVEDSVEARRRSGLVRAVPAVTVVVVEEVIGYRVAAVKARERLGRGVQRGPRQRYPSRSGGFRSPGAPGERRGQHDHATQPPPAVHHLRRPLQLLIVHATTQTSTVSTDTDRPVALPTHECATIERHSVTILTIQTQKHSFTPYLSIQIRQLFH